VRPPTWPVAAGSLVLGFAVAQATGVRPLGGAVLAAGAVWCALRWRAAVGTAAAVALVALYLAAFAASHVLADALGAWGAVALVAAVVAAAAYLVADRRAVARR
jgi:NhaP-type Na+/H+ or K+/H+ antiporter